ncbi:MAG: PAS domain-containing protein, partial [Chitinophagaceae bacterium]|nr:PAS domain-containing protein [Chitinophagaceae bacterium]
MKKRSQRFILPILSLLLTLSVIFFFTEVSISWKITIVVLSCAIACVTLWLDRSPDTPDAAIEVNSELRKKRSLQELSMLLEYNDAIISILNAQMHTLFRSPAAARITGWPDAEFGLRSVAEHCHPDDCSLFSQAFQSALDHPDTPRHVSFRLQHKHGHYIWLEGWVTNMLENPAVQGVVTNLRDVTVLKKMAAEAAKNSRFYQFLSEVNHMIVQAVSEEQLFTDACRIAVNTGGYRYAFVALMNEDNSFINLHSYAGLRDSGDASTGIKLLKDYRYAADGILKGYSYFIQEINEKGDPVFDWHSDEEKVSLQISSLIFLPVSVDNLPVGVACIWSGPGYYFDESEIRLL